MRGVLPGVGDDAVIALWTGGLYAWFDPMLVLQAAAAAATRRAGANLRLVFLGTSHPSSRSRRRPSRRSAPGPTSWG